jgi:hypothetical protein
MARLLVLWLPPLLMVLLRMLRMRLSERACGLE